jgi:hypothetical protein
VKKTYLLLLTGMFLALDLCAGTLTSSVDNTHPAVNEHFILTVQYDGDPDDEAPNVFQLQKNFTVLSTSQSTNVQIINGHLSRSTIWTYEVLARDSGKLLIPAFKVKGDFSEAIQLEVSNAPKLPGLHGDNKIYVETELDNNSVHVQEQAIITWRIISHVNLSDPELQPPQIDNVLTQNLGSRQYQRGGADGSVENVVEQRYALFPQISGDINIPSEKIQITTNSMQRFGMGIMAPIASVVDIVTQPQTLRVLPAVPSKHALWIPARSLTITEDMQGLDNQQATVGAAFTRAIKIRAAGISAEQLPPLEFTSDDFRSYNDHPQLQNEVDANGIVGNREERFAMIATREGVFTLPEIRIPWYNTATSHWEEAILPATTITVLPATGKAQQTTSVAPAIHDPAKTNPDVNTNPDANAVTAQPQDTATSLTPSDNRDHTLRIWQGTAALLFVLWLTSMGWMWKQKNSKPVKSECNAPDVAKKKHFLDKFSSKSQHTSSLLSAAASTGDMKTLQLEILNWAQQQWPTETPVNLSDIAHRIDNTELAAQLLALERHLYGNGPAPVDPQQLAATLQHFSQTQHTQTPATDQQLDDLYR